jgi:hypothetical protein
MYIYHRNLLGPQSLLKEQPITSPIGQRNFYYLDRGISAFGGRGESSGSYVWANEGLGQLTPEDAVKGLMKQLQPLFWKNFSKNKITYGPKVGNPVNFRVIADKDFKAEVVKEAKRLADSALPLHLKFAPEKVREKLEGFYKAMGGKVPARLQTINENTRLTAEEKAATFTLPEVMTVVKIKADADKIGAFYSPSTKEIVFRESKIDAGAVAHEMAHAYSDQGWHDLISLMRLRGMKETDKLDEGMTTLIERIVVNEWHANQPSNTTIPLAAYDSTYTDRADDFVKQLGKDLAFEAYFGGWIDFASNAKPEDTLIIGNKKKKKWKWPWRYTIRSFRWVFR